MHLLDANNQLMKYDTPEQILEDFYHIRLELYKQRRSARIRELKIALLLLENTAKYIGKVCKGEILMFPLKENDERCAELKEKGFQSSQSIAWMVHPVGRKVTKKEELRTGYDYLLSTPVESFSYEKMKGLEQERDEKNNEFRELTNASPKSLWLKDLDALIRQLDAEKYPSAEKRAPAKRAPDAAGPQRANKKSCM
ncbi:hypothetical protein CTI12_AA144040 [Artemisia annua]|uniref:DNA topoisomerase (ATP-hydrolyzing) n=1 Tax=Artemisia annua TaxID=35608 RepID=A0A2U1PJQ3_ARTAN|nr:hypothetical protein CTI12_AA144040 [Artemisia annua]